MRHFIINFTLAVLCYVLSFNAFVRCYIHGCSVLFFRWRQPVSPAIPPRYHLSYRESFTFTSAPRTLQIRITSQARSASKPKAFISCSSPSRDRAQVTSDVSAIKLSDQDAQLNPNLTGRLQKQTSDRLHPWVMHDWGSLPGDVEILCHNLNHKSPHPMVLSSSTRHKHASPDLNLQPFRRHPELVPRQGSVRRSAKFKKCLRLILFKVEHQTKLILASLAFFRDFSFVMKGMFVESRNLKEKLISRGD